MVVAFLEQNDPSLDGCAHASMHTLQHAIAEIALIGPCVCRKMIEAGKQATLVNADADTAILRSVTRVVVSFAEKMALQVCVFFMHR